MSRCSICDYSQSADSSYNSGLQLSRSLTNNRVIYSKHLETDICLSCLEDYNFTKNYWSYIDGDGEFNAYIPDDEAAAEYEGCTDKPSD